MSLMPLLSIVVPNLYLWTFTTALFAEGNPVRVCGPAGT